MRSLASLHDPGRTAQAGPSATSMVSVSPLAKLSAIMAKDRLSRLADEYRVTSSRFRMKDIDPGDTLGLDMKEEAGDLLKSGIERLAELQERMYAQDRWALLLVFQALDAAGKDGTIKHVMSGV